MPSWDRLIVILTASIWLHQSVFQCNTNAQNILAKYKRGYNVEKFLGLVLGNEGAASQAENEITIFSPSDDAMNAYKGKKPLSQQIIMNSMVNTAFDVSEILSLGNTGSNTITARLSSLSQGSPPLWLTRKNNDFYVNGAKFVMRNLAAKSLTNKKQMLHIVDTVLEPLCPKSRTNSLGYMHLTAGKLLRDSDNYDLGDHSIKKFAGKVQELSMKEKTLSKKRSQLYDKPGRHTFFVPVDAAFENFSPFLVDEDVVAGHVVQDTLMFTNPIDSDEHTADKHTATYDENMESGIKVVIRVHPGNQRDPSERNKVYVRSDVNLGNRNHVRHAIVQAEILKRNIPVSNGVVHLIGKPLVKTASDLWAFLKQEEEEGGRLSKFARYLRLYGKDLKDKLSLSTGSTIFAPSNVAFNRTAKLLGGQDKLEELLKKQKDNPKILGLHFIEEQVPSTDIRITKPQNFVTCKTCKIKMFGAKVEYPEGGNDRLWFYISDTEGEFIKQKLVVDGLGVTATVREPDIGATNGIIHVVDKVLGIPSSTIEEKLQDDPMLSSTFTLGAQDHFNKILEKTDQKFTYLVPSNEAWKNLQLKMASTFKVLFHGDFAYQTEQILQRHLRIGGALSVKELVDMTKKDGGVRMLRGFYDLKFKEVDNGKNVIVEWEDLEIKVIRPNLECTNGYIHVIDQVIMKRRDVVLAAGGVISMPKIAIMVIALAATQWLS